jgi:hypothetical protein
MNRSIEEFNNDMRRIGDAYKKLFSMKAGDRYRHYKGKTYIVVVPEALMEDDQKQMVVYKSEDSGIVWVRDIASFEGTINTESGHLKRFVRID